MPELSGIIQNYLEGSIKTIGRVPVIESKTITENGTYTAPEGVDGYSPITVNIPAYEPVIQEKIITENGTYTAPEGVDGYSPITVDVPIPLDEQLTATENGTFTPDTGYRFNQVTVNVPNKNILTNCFNSSIASSMGVNYDIDGIDISWNGGAQIVCTLSGIADISSYSKLKVSFTTGTSYYNTVGAHVVRELYVGITETYISPGTMPNNISWLTHYNVHDDNHDYTYTWNLTELTATAMYIYISANGWNVNNLKIELS